jgi:hypothetical protein
MLHQKSRLPREEIVDTMIDLAHLGKTQRIVLAGQGSTDIYLALKQRGFLFSVLASVGRAAGGQHAAGLIAGCESYAAIETALVQVSSLLNSTADIAIAIQSRENGLVGRVRTKLQQLGFRIEAGARCREGFVLAAHRQEFNQGFGVIRRVA